MRNRRYEEATDAYKKAIKLRPKSVRARADLARGYIQMGRSDDAVEVLRNAFRMTPKSVEPGIMLALILLKQGKYDETLGIASKLIKRAPENPAGFNLMASAQWAKGDEESARENLQHAITVDPNYL